MAELKHKVVSREEMSKRQREILTAYDQEVLKRQKEIADLTARKRQLALDAQTEINEKEKALNKLKIEITDLKIQLANKEVELNRMEKKP